MKDKHAKFLTLAERRVSRALNEMRLVGNLANTHNYEYSADEAQRIVSALEGELKLLKSKFSSGLGKGKTVFKF